jgi:hypothetical protein
MLYPSELQPRAFDFTTNHAAPVYSHHSPNEISRHVPNRGYGRGFHFVRGFAKRILSQTKPDPPSADPAKTRGRPTQPAFSLA